MSTTKHTISADNRTYTFDDGRMRMMLPSKVTIPKPIAYDPKTLTALWRTTHYVVDVLESRKLDYFAIGGTLLGAVRQHGTLPWDLDVDLAITKTTYDALVADMPADTDTYVWRDVRCPGLRVYVDGCAMVDLFVVDEIETDRFVFSAPYDAATDRATFDCHTYLFPRLQIARDDLFPTKTIDFDDGKIRVPKNPEAWLLRNYAPSCLDVVVGPSKVHSTELHRNVYDLLECEHVYTGLFTRTRSQYPHVYRTIMRQIGTIFQQGFEAYGGTRCDGATEEKRNQDDIRQSLREHIMYFLTWRDGLCILRNTTTSQRARFLVRAYRSVVDAIASSSRKT